MNKVDYRKLYAGICDAYDYIEYDLENGLVNNELESQTEETLKQLEVAILLIKGKIK